MTDENMTDKQKHQWERRCKRCHNEKILDHDDLMLLCNPCFSNYLSDDEEGAEEKASGQLAPSHFVRENMIFFKGKKSTEEKKD